LPNGLYLFFDGNFSATESRVLYWDESEFVPDHLKAEGKPVALARRLWSRGLWTMDFMKTSMNFSCIPSGWIRTNGR